MDQQPFRPGRGTERFSGAQRDTSLIFRGVVPWPEDIGNWRRATRESLAETAGREVRRTVWDAPEAPERRLLVDVIECTSADEALAALADRVEWNEMAELPPGPPELGVASFMHPPGPPPAVFFARANLCVAVLSFARDPVPAAEVAQRFDARLRAARAPGPRADVPGFRVTAAARRARQAVAVELELPFQLADDAYLRYEARGATLTIDAGEVVATPRAGEEASVTVTVLERGRAPLEGRVAVPSR